MRQDDAAQVFGVPPAELTVASDVDVVVPVLATDTPRVRRWLAGTGQPPLRARDRWQQRPWIRMSPTRTSLTPDVTLSPAAAQLDLLLRAAREGLRTATIADDRGSQRLLPLAPGERALLSRRYDHPLVGLARSLATGRRRATSERPVVCFAAVDWWFHNRAHSDVQLAKRMAADRPVLLVNSIGLRIPRPGSSSQPVRRIARKLASLARGVRAPVANLPSFHVFSPLALPPSANSALQAAVARAAAWQIRAVCAWLGMQRPHVLVTIPSAVDIVEHLPHASLVVNRSDLHSAFPEVDTPRIEALETRLLHTADAVLYVSHELMGKDRPLVADRAHFLGHGVDAEHFRAVPPEEWPRDIAAVPGPRIGFFGGLDDYVIDFALLARVADDLPDAQLVLIGDATCDMTELVSRPNVIWLGQRDYADIPAYGSAFDVGIMPWLDNEWIRFCNPVKLKEYLALGLPVVTTDFPELREFRTAVSVALADQFSVAIRVALATPNDEVSRAARRRLVLADTWEAKADEVLSLMRRVEGGS